jgi:hypothetical protein
MLHFVFRHAARGCRRAVVIAAGASTLVSCGLSSDAVTRRTAKRAAESADVSVDPLHMLDVASRITDANVNANGSCLATAARPDRSRLLYLIVSEDTAFIRLNVVTSTDGAQVEMIDFVRGLPSGGQWSATQPHPHDQLVARTFASSSDRSPKIGYFGADGAEAQHLRDLATATLALACSLR